MCRHGTAATGEWGRVVWAVAATGQRPALEFFEKLSNEEAAKVQALFERLAEHGRIRNNEQFKKLGDRQGHAIWEFKSYQLRFLGAFTPGSRCPRGSRPPEEEEQTPLGRSRSGCKDSDGAHGARQRR